MKELGLFPMTTAYLDEPNVSWRIVPSVALKTIPFSLTPLSGPRSPMPSTPLATPWRRRQGDPDRGFPSAALR
jgi:hypothetical protein